MSCAQRPQTDTDIGDRLNIRLKKGLINLPTDKNTPLICVGPGTGIAPVRAILEERALLHAYSKQAPPDMHLQPTHRSSLDSRRQHPVPRLPLCIQRPALRRRVRRARGPRASRVPRRVLAGWPRGGAEDVRAGPACAGREARVGPYWCEEGVPVHLRVSTRFSAVYCL